MKLFLAALTIVLLLPAATLYSQTAAKHRVIILTDIENEPDDTESMIRLLLYSNLMDIKGLVATTSVHFGADNIYLVSFTAPVVEKPETTQIILKVTDKGTPALSRYKRVQLRIEP
jgi:hypothetical protein